MQVKTQLKYCLFSFIVLFTVLGTVLGKDDVSKSILTAQSANLPADTKYNGLLSEQDAASDEDARISYNAGISDFAISHKNVLQTSFNFAGKKVQHDKEILKLISARHSNAVKVFNGNRIIFADELTHIFLFLFPYHFFW